MKIFRILWLAAWFMLAAMTAAYADPITGLVSLLVSSIGSLGTLGQLIVGAALSVGSTLLQRAMTPKNKQAVPGIQGQIQVGGDNPLSFIFGTYATAGQLEYVNTAGNSGKTPNAYLTQVVTLSDLPVTAILPKVWINGERCTIDDILDPGGRGNQVAEYRTGPNSNYLFMKRHLGDQTAADPFLLSQFGGDADRPWTSDMIGRGLAYAVVTAQVNRELFTGPPQCRFEVQGIRLYDPRFDSTVGGSGSQRYADPATWQFSDNPAVVIYNILRGIWYGTQWVYGLQDLPATRLPLSNWFAAMNECDRIVGGAKQFRCGGEIRTNQEPAEVINELLKACNGRMAEIGGIYKIRVGAPTLPVYAYTDETISVTDPRSFDPFPGLEATHNGVQYSYPEPEAAWEMKDAPVRLRSDLEALDDGRRLVADVKFNYVPFAVQSQQLAKALIETNRKFRKHKAVLPPEAYDLEPLDVISWTSESEGYSNKLFDIESMDDLDNVNQGVAIREVDPSDYDWNPATDPLPSSVGYLGPIRPPAQPMVDFFAEPAVIEDNDGNPRRPAIKLSWDGDQPDVIGVEYEVRNGVSLETQYSSRMDQPSIGAILISQGLLPNTLYGVRARYIPGSSRQTLWSGWLLVITPDIRLGAEDIYLPGMVDDVIASMAGHLEWLAEGVHYARDELDRLNSLAADAAAQSDRDTFELKTEVGSSIAEYRREILVVATATEASAIRIEELTARIDDPETGLQATASAVSTLSVTVSTIGDEVTAIGNSVDSLTVSVGNVTASGLARTTVEATQAGALATIGWSVAASAGGPASQAALIMSARTDGLSEIGMIADRIYMMSGGAKRRPFIFQSGTLYLDDVRVNTLSALSAVLGNVDISNAIIGNLIVGTSNLAFGAVTEMVTMAGTFTGASSSYDQVVPTPLANATMIQLDWSGTFTGDGITGRFRMVNATTGAILFEESHTPGSSTVYGGRQFFFGLNTAGNTTFRFQGTNVIGGSATARILVWKR
ncbi:phage tail protein [Phyllobacterium sp. 21LDTY02-6]|uniref:phage tail protein n=1 Tax=Phyllobacterium sp. 21LDTY02-6 TaxID=2944903 RepID=UPI0020204466|nr:phage tail protein [Phyllobacterium sp. 21LDTY02-6]MCO4316351.1 phage tail protein [Phyllobacterium sp. 21LDTY02-6]